MPMRRSEIHNQTEGKGLPEMEERMSGWMPISTAPKDGTWILTWDGYAPDVLRWIENTLGKNPSWRDIEYFQRKPTHWQPLPAPPTEG